MPLAHLAARLGNIWSPEAFGHAIKNVSTQPDAAPQLGWKGTKVRSGSASATKVVMQLHWIACRLTHAWSTRRFGLGVDSLRDWLRRAAGAGGSGLRRGY